MLFKPFVNFPLFMLSQNPPPQINIMSPQRFLYVIFITIRIFDCNLRKILYLCK